jgi:hypothetical protein
VSGAQKMPSGWRSRYDLFTPEMRAVRQASLHVEALGANELLTRAGDRLREATDLLATWHEDGRPGGNTSKAVAEILRAFGTEPGGNTPEGEWRYTPGDAIAGILRPFGTEAKPDGNMEEDPAFYSANATQVGGSHYKGLPLEPWDLSVLYQLDPFEHEILAYVLRAPHKNGLEDLKKSRHWLDKKIEVEELYRAAPGGPYVRGTAPREVCLAILKAAVAKLERIP